MERSKSLQLAILAAVCLAVPLPTAHAAIVISGDVDPADAGDWSYDSTRAVVGKTTNGELEVDDGSNLASRYGYIGYADSATGHVTVTGAGSTWTNRDNLYIGVLGSGTLNISDGAEVSADGPTYVGYVAGSTGLIHFGTGGGTLTTKSLAASPTQLTGTGVIRTLGLVSDVGLVFDSTPSLTQTIALNNQPGQNVTVHLDMTGNSYTNGHLGAGWQGHGSVAIRDGVTVNSYYGYIGYHTGSTGVVTVDGADSTWITSGYLDIGRSGNGTFNITGGAAVSNSGGYVGHHSGSIGVVTVHGTASTWTNRSHFFVGNEGDGTFNISGGAAASGWTGYIGYASGSTGVVTVDGTGSTLTNKGGLYVGLSGNGTLNISGGAKVSTDGSTYVAYATGSTGLIQFGTGGGTLTTRCLLASPADLVGTGSVYTRSLVSDVDLVLDSTASLTQTLAFNSQPDQNVTIHLDMASDPGSNGFLGAGWKDHGSLVIQGGVTVKSYGGYIGCDTGSTGVVTVDGAGSAWTNDVHLSVGRRGSGSLNITGGAAVSNKYGEIGLWPGSTGVVTIDGIGSKWTNGNYLHVGGEGSGTLNITGGSVVSSRGGSIGADSGSTGTVTVAGAGSMWASIGDRQFSVGGTGSGTGALNITGGGTVSSSKSIIGLTPDSTGVVTVDGTGSTWTNSGHLIICKVGGAALHITGGAAVSAERVSTNMWSLRPPMDALLAIDVGNGSRLQIDGGSGTITNDGVVRILAGARATARNVYAPIAASEWSGNGGYQAVGGTWDGTGHRFSVSGVVPGTSGSMVTIDRSQTQRLLINDPQTGWSVGASFLAADAASEVHVTARAVSGSTLAELESILDAGDSVRGAWMFDVTGGYSWDDPAYLSFDLGPGFDRSDVRVWHHDGSQWAEYAAADLTCNGDYASFTVTGFSGYAVSAVPEPGTLALLAAAGLTLLGLRRWRRV